jgi:hypothetical protein
VKSGLTQEEHVQLGTELRAMRDRLLRTVIELSRRYAIRSKSVLLASRAEIAVGDLRCELDDLFLAENPDGKSPYY